MHHTLYGITNTKSNSITTLLLWTEGRKGSSCAIIYPPYTIIHMYTHTPPPLPLRTTQYHYIHAHTPPSPHTSTTHHSAHIHTHHHHYHPPPPPHIAVLSHPTLTLFRLPTSSEHHPLVIQQLNYGKRNATKLRA